MEDLCGHLSRLEEHLEAGAPPGPLHLQDQVLGCAELGQAGGKLILLYPCSKI